MDTLHAATELAARLAESLAFLPELDAGEVTVSAEDAQHERYRVFCDRLLLGAGRCGEREGHPGPCVAGPPSGPAATTGGRALVDAVAGGRAGDAAPPAG
ncbi:hypothetical protein [Plantactinospora sp. WMMB782]|uniref:hypothetical protein n=1 Tax=Plantactinospora sp. WMMB782 TaxID=3404121 RepID=UPI003B926FE1